MKPSDKTRKKTLGKGKHAPLTPDASELRRRAEARMPKRPRRRTTAVDDSKAAADTQRLLHELQVHQIELEMQNAELQESRDRSEALLEKYVDLYDFAPVGYFSLNKTGRILETNLTGSALLGVERSRLISQFLRRFMAQNSRTVFRDFLAKIFAGAAKQVCEAEIFKEDGTSFWASLHGHAPIALGGTQDVCRVVIMDITVIKQAQETQRRLETISALNEELKQEIIRRQAVEETLRKSESQQRDLLEESRHMQAQLRAMSHSLIQAREEERKRISRDLHDEISQTLIGINVQLEALTRESTLTPRVLRQKISRTQRLVEKSVAIVHQFAVKLRPSSLDDLGLIVTLKTFLNDFMKQTGIRAYLTAFTAVDQLNSDQRTMLYRIVQIALANVIEHSCASRVTVSLSKLADTIHLEISDDGKAFDVERMMHAGKSKHLGLLDMRERAEMLGGTFMVESEPGKGTTIHVRIPIDPR